MQEQRTELTAQQKLQAICWQAKQVQSTYGVLCAELEVEEKEEIYLRYAAFLQARKAAENSWLHTPQPIAPKN